MLIHIEHTWINCTVGYIAHMGRTLGRKNEKSFYLQLQESSKFKLVACNPANPTRATHLNNKVKIVGWVFEQGRENEGSFPLVAKSTFASSLQAIASN